MPEDERGNIIFLFWLPLWEGGACLPSLLPQWGTPHNQDVDSDAGKPKSSSCALQSFWNYSSIYGIGQCLGYSRLKANEPVRRLGTGNYNQIQEATSEKGQFASLYLALTFESQVEILETVLSQLASRKVLSAHQLCTWCAKNNFVKSGGLCLKPLHTVLT